MLNARREVKINFYIWEQFHGPQSSTLGLKRKCNTEISSCDKRHMQKVVAVNIPHCSDVIFATTQRAGEDERF